MTTREIYFKTIMQTDLPVGMVGYIIKKNNVIQLGNNICLRFDNHEENIDKMKSIEKIDGFMFWGYSDEGENFIRDNRNEISSILTNMILNQK